MRYTCHKTYIKTKQQINSLHKTTLNFKTFLLPYLARMVIKYVLPFNLHYFEMYFLKIKLPASTSGEVSLATPLPFYFL